jgi:hypothetical protein
VNINIFVLDRAKPRKIWVLGRLGEVTTKLSAQLATLRRFSRSSAPIDLLLLSIKEVSEIAYQH